MNPDNNWKEVRATAKDLSELLGVSERTVEDFLVILENLIIHRFIEALLDYDNEGESTYKDISIELPYLGNLVVTIDENNQISTNFVLRKVFYRKLKKSVHTLESPLTNQLMNILGDNLVKLFEEGEIDERNNKA